MRDYWDFRTICKVSINAFWLISQLMKKTSLIQQFARSLLIKFSNVSAGEQIRMKKDTLFLDHFALFSEKSWSHLLKTSTLSLSMVLTWKGPQEYVEMLLAALATSSSTTVEVPSKTKSIFMSLSFWIFSKTLRLIEEWKSDQ